MAELDDYLRARGGESLRLARALSGAERPARELLLRALVEVRGGFNAMESPQAQLRQAIVRGYLSPWRRSNPGNTNDPLVRLPRPQRAVAVLKFLEGLSFLDIAELLGGSPNAAARIAERAEATVGTAEIVAALKDCDSTSPGLQALLAGEAVARRRRARQRIAVGASVLAVALAVGVLTNPPGKPAPQPTPSTGPAPVRLVPAIFAIPVFPYRATFLPSDAGSPVVHQDGERVTMEYRTFSISVSGAQPRQVPRKRVDHIWERDGRWLRLASDRISIAEADQVMAGLVPGEVVMELPRFTITLMPAGYVLRRANPFSICLAASREQEPVGLCVTSLPNVLGQASWPVQPVSVSVHGRAAELIYPPGLAAELWIYLSELDAVRVSLEETDASRMLTAQDLLTFADGLILQARP